MHLEVVCDLSAEPFLKAFRRFVSHKSLPKVMISDNASTYVAASKELEQIFTSDKLGECHWCTCEMKVHPKMSPLVLLKN